MVMRRWRLQGSACLPASGLLRRSRAASDERSGHVRLVVHGPMGPWPVWLRRLCNAFCCRLTQHKRSGVWATRTSFSRFHPAVAWCAILGGMKVYFGDHADLPPLVIALPAETARALVGAQARNDRH